jgi:hypothetical protein
MSIDSQMVNRRPKQKAIVRVRTSRSESNREH